MAKPRKTLHTRIPRFSNDYARWRRGIRDAVARDAKARGINYSPQDRLELELVIYLEENDLFWHDVDNRLKDVMDALQGRAGGSKTSKPFSPIIGNDRQIHRVVVTKANPPIQSKSMGHLTLRLYRPRGKGTRNS